MDETYQTYIERVARLTQPATYRTQLENIQESPKFAPQPDGIRRATPFPGYSAITPPCKEDPINGEFYHRLQASQQQLLAQLEPGVLVPVPPESFHLTLADLIWNGAYRDAVKENPRFAEQLKACIADSFHKYERSAAKGTLVQWQVLGLMIRPRAMTVALIPKDEASYRSVLELRRTIYQNAELIKLGIEQQYYFTAHVTLGYFAEIKPDLDRDRLCDLLAHFNETWLESNPQILKIKRVELRKFEDMTRYEREPDFPVVEL